MTVRERPILFSGQMVRAILDGTKTQTRRVVKPQPNGGSSATMVDLGGAFGLLDGILSGEWRCPYGQPGDRLWVREAFFDHGPLNGHEVSREERIEYREDEWDRCGGDAGGRWKPSIHMPRWASRLTLEITDVRVERLDDISEADAIAEGAVVGESSLTQEMSGTARGDYARIWNDINEKRGHSWASNPWVWVLTFASVVRP